MIFILASIVITAAVIGIFRVGARGDELTDDQIMALGEFRPAQEIRASHDGDLPIRREKAA